jgi:SAM-dependent methyltransferase
VLAQLWGFWRTKTLLAAHELDVAGRLGGATLTVTELTERLGIHPRGAQDFFDALAALDVLERGPRGYTATASARAYLDAARPATYMGAPLRTVDARLNDLSSDLVAALRSGQPSYGGTDDGQRGYAELYATPETVAAFASLMTAASMGATMALAERFPWDRHQVMADLGCAEGALCAHTLAAWPHLRAIAFDLPALRPCVRRYARQHGVADRLRFVGGDFFTDPLPEADVLVLGHVLHNWGASRRQLLLARAHEALRPGGALIVYDWTIDRDGGDPYGLFMSLTMLMTTPAGACYSPAECERWLRQAGFAGTETARLDGPVTMIVGHR